MPPARSEAVILSAVRTPVGKFQGGLALLSATELGVKVVAEAVRRAGIEPPAVDEVIMGNVVQAGLGQNPARQAALGGGLHPRVAAMTINKVCGSGLKESVWKLGLAGWKSRGIMIPCRILLFRSLPSRRSGSLLN